MNFDFNFNDPNLLIDDFSFPGNKHRAQVKALQLPTYIQNDLFLETGASELKNASVQREGNSITIEAFVRERFPKQAREAFLLANEMKHRLIRYKKDGENDCLWCDWETPNRSHPKGTIERHKYLSSAKYLPPLLQEYGEIIIESGKEERFADFKKNYRIQNLWIEYYLLGESEVLVELGFERPKQNQYRPGKMAAKLHGLIQDIWFEAKACSNPICEWILSYDSPDQVWFALELLAICNQWSSLPPKNGYQFYQSEKPILNRLKDHEGKGVSLIYEAEDNCMTLDQAIAFTILRLVETGREPNHYQEYLQSRIGQANKALKAPKAKPKKGFGS